MEPRLEDLHRALDAGDTDWLVGQFHDEFMFIDDYELLNREEFIYNFLNNLPSENIVYHNERQFIADNDEVAVWSFVREVEGVPTKDTHVHLKKDGKFWRHTIHRQPLA